MSSAPVSPCLVVCAIWLLKEYGHWDDHGGEEEEQHEDAVEHQTYLHPLVILLATPESVVQLVEQVPDSAALVQQQTLHSAGDGRNVTGHTARLHTHEISRQALLGILPLSTTKWRMLIDMGNYKPRNDQLHTYIVWSLCQIKDHSHLIFALNRRFYLERNWNQIKPYIIITSGWVTIVRQASSVWKGGGGWGNFSLKRRKSGLKVGFIKINIRKGWLWFVLSVTLQHMISYGLKQNHGWHMGWTVNVWRKRDHYICFKHKLALPFTPPSPTPSSDNNLV